MTVDSSQLNVFSAKFKVTWCRN